MDGGCGWPVLLLGWLFLCICMCVCVSFSTNVRYMCTYFSFSSLSLSLFSSSLLSSFSPTVPPSSPLSLTKVLLDDFSSCGGYKLLYEYLLYLEKKGTEEAREAERNLILLMQKLIFAGFVDLEPKLSDGGPFQDPNFTTPVPLGESTFSRAIIYAIVRNFRMV